jgi:hypothetical protein
MANDTNSEKKSLCTSEVFKRDISELCSDCPHTETINEKVKSFLKRIEEQKELLPDNLFKDTVQKEMLDLSRKIGDYSAAYDLPKRHMKRPHKDFLSINILNYLSGREKLKALKTRYKEVPSFKQKRHGLTDNYEIALRHYFLEEAKKLPQLQGKQIVEEYGAKKVEVFLDELRKEKLNYKRKGLLKQLNNVKESLSEHPEVQQSVSNHIDKIN